jgi:signal transduction histidine kinase
VTIEALPEEVAVGVADTGPGISSDEHEVIFGRFVRGANAKGMPGNGLGLSLARMISRAHGGDIRVSSKMGEGATFAVTLPRRGAIARESGSMTKR